MRLIKVLPRNPGDKKFRSKETLLKELKFYKHKFNNRSIPEDKRRILFITCFCEFGCESLSVMYCIPKILRDNPGVYVICVGWYGRQYLYQHLVDEYWELDEEFQYLRDYGVAFVHGSRNLLKLEKVLKNFGRVFKTSQVGSISVANVCVDCNNYFSSTKNQCPKCNSINIHLSLLNDIPFHKRLAIPIPQPSAKSKKQAESYLKPNSVGIFARNRTTYGRNLPADFYIKLINLLESLGYNPIWLGEKQNVMPCPVDYICDFSRLPESRDLELTLAIISQLKFTVQFWTASTRLSSMVNTPWLLFETPEQIVGDRGQEGKRIALTTDPNRKKLVICQYHNVVQNQDKALAIIKDAIFEMNNNNWDDIIGLVEQPKYVRLMLEKQKLWR